MRLEEIIYQGIFNSPTPTRIELPSGVGRVQLPSNTSFEDIQDLIISLFYPARTPQRLRVAYARTSAKLVIRVKHLDQTYRFVRLSDAKSLRVQQQTPGGWQDVAAGDDVERYVQQTFQLPPFELFWAVNLWRFEDDPSALGRVDIEALEPRIQKMIRSYREAQKTESLDDVIAGLEAQVAELMKAQGVGAGLEQKLEKAWEKMKDYEIGDVAEEDIGLIREKEARMGTYRDKLQRLTEEEEGEREKIYRAIPSPWFKRPEFWGGLLTGAGCIAVSVVLRDTSWRMLAMGNVVGAGVCAWTLLAYFGGLENAGVHQIRLESIKRRLNQVREEQAALQEHLNHLMIHAQVDNSQELTAKVAMGAKLRVMIEKMEQKMSSIRSDKQYQERKTELDEVREKLEDSRVERARFQDDMMSVYQLEADLIAVGIQPEMVLDSTSESGGVEEGNTPPLGRLLQSAKLVGQTDGNTLEERTRKMWGKIAGHVLGERFGAVGVTPSGELTVGDLGEAQMKMWRRTRASEERVVLYALGIAIQVIGSQSIQMWESVVIQDPSESVTSDQAKKLREVFRSAAKRSDVALLVKNA